LSALDSPDRARLTDALSVSGGFRELGYQRHDESEADHIGVFLMAFAGYDPEAAVAFWERMTRAGGRARVPEILSDHPSDERRVAQLRAWAEHAAAARAAYRAGHVAGR
jgi:predicted Zn-dependent protease